MNRSLPILAAVFVALVLALPSQAQAPAQLAYQGALELNGTPVADGTYSLTFVLFDDEEDGHDVWSETHPSVAVEDGIFFVYLGSGSPLNPMEFSIPLWLETIVGGTTMSPRTALGASPYALGLVAPITLVSEAPFDPAMRVESTASTGIHVKTFETTGRTAVLAEATATTGSFATVRGLNHSSSGIGVEGLSFASSGVAYGVFGSTGSTDGIGVSGIASATTGATYGVWGQTNSTSGIGVYGRAFLATGGANYGVFGTSQSIFGTGVYGTAPFYGVHGETASTLGGAVGVFGEATGSSGINYGVFGTAASTSGTAVYGSATASSGFAYGVYGRSSSTSGRGVYGLATATTGATNGVYGLASSSLGRGVFGVATSGSGIGVLGFGEATSGTNFGVVGQTSSTSGRAVYGFATANSGTNYGVYGVSNSANGYAGYFLGRVNVTGTLSKGGGAFQIDHPLDPENRILRHSFVESPDMMNVYNGNATTDGQGYTTVDLPDYFEALNRDFRYQLTVVGQTFAQAIVSQEVRGGRFEIRTSEPNVRVSWQVTGIRQDAWADENRIIVEEAKKAEHIGRDLHPTAFGLARARGVDYNAEEEARWEEERAQSEAEHERRTEEHTRLEAERERRDAERTRRAAEQPANRPLPSPVPRDQ